MQLDDYDSYDTGGQLSGGWLKKKLKKLLKPALHIGAAVFTGGASLKYSASILQAERQRKMQQAALAAQQKMAEAQAKEFQAMMTPLTLAPSADSVRNYLPSPTAAYNYKFTSDGARESQSTTQQPWLVPVAVGGGVLVLAALIASRR